MDQLYSDGYYILREFTDTKLWDSSFSCPLVHHGRIASRIAECIIDLNKITGWNAQVSKFRASASCELTASNATDAGALHRDIMSYGSELPQVYTLVIYLDDAYMKVVSGSHKHRKISSIDILTRTKSSIHHMNPGDAIVFHACLLHAGIFYPIRKSRRVVQ